MSALRRFIRRFWVSRREYDRIVDVLQLAYGHIVSHHSCDAVQRAGQFCPVCHHKDNSEPEMDAIVMALHRGREGGVK